MSQHGADGGGGTDALAVLELLAQQAPPGRYEALLGEARRAGASPAELARLERAVQLAAGICSSFDRREQREAGLAALVDTARDLTLPYDLDSLLRVITRRAKRLLDFDMAYVSLRDTNGSSFVLTTEGSHTGLTTGLRVIDGHGLGGEAHTHGEPAWTADYLEDDRFPHARAVDEVVRAEGLHAIMAVPLRSGDTTVGALYGADRRVRHYTPDEIGLMSSLADLAAVAIEKAGLLDQTRAEVTELELDSSRARSSLTRMRHVSEAHSRIMNLVLAGGDLCNVAKAAGDALDGTVMIRDPGGRSLASGGEIPGLDEEAVAKASLDAHAGRRP
ncbi:GAF domain-containing protein, partial [Streptomyces lateritius]